MKKFTINPPVILAIATFFGIIFLYIHDRVSHPDSVYFIPNTLWLLEYATFLALEVGLCVAGIILAFKSLIIDKTKILLILLSIATPIGEKFIVLNQLPVCHVYHNTPTALGFINMAIFALFCAHFAGFIVSFIFHSTSKLKRQFICKSSA